MTDEPDIDAILSELGERIAAHEKLRSTGSLAEVAESRDGIEELRSQLGALRKAAKPAQRVSSGSAAPVASHGGPSLGVWPAAVALGLIAAITLFFLVRPTDPLKVVLSDTLTNCEWKINGSITNRTDDDLNVDRVNVRWFDAPNDTWVTMDLANQLDSGPAPIVAGETVRFRRITTLTEPCPEQIGKIVHEKIQLTWTSTDGQMQTSEHAF